MPGGRLEENEQLDKCAIRETKEETGYIIAIDRKIGEYHQPQYDDMQHIFLGKLLGGEPINNGPETAKIGWFNPSRLPLLMVPNGRKQINNFMKHQNSLIKETLKTPFMVRLLKKICEMVIELTGALVEEGPLKRSNFFIKHLSN